MHRYHKRLIFFNSELSLNFLSLLVLYSFIFRRSHPDVFCRKRSATLLKKRLWHRCFLVNFAKFLRAPFFTERLRWLLLYLGRVLSGSRKGNKIFRIQSIESSRVLQKAPTIPVDTGRKFNEHKTFRRHPGRLLNVLCTFSLRPVSTGKIFDWVLKNLQKLLYI